MFRRHPNQCEHPANMSFKSCFSWGGGSYKKTELIKNKFCQSLTHDPVRIFEGYGWTFFFFKLDFISRRFHIRFMIWLEILKSYSRMAEKLIQSMWKFYNCFNTYVCNQTKQWHSFLTSCGNAKHMVTMKINFGIGWIF